MIVRRSYPVTGFLIVLNLIGFVWEFVLMGPGILTGDVNPQRLYEAGALVPAAVLQDHEYWRIVTGAFLHGSLLHIAVNMFSLWSLGRFIEEIAGSIRMSVIYVVSLIVSGLGVVYFSTLNVATVGASGAIFGLFGALFAIGLKLGKPGMQLVRANIGLLIVNLFITFTIPEISKAAHVAGLLSGFVLAYAIYYPPQIARATVVDTQTGTELESEIQGPERPYGQ